MKQRGVLLLTVILLCAAAVSAQEVSGLRGWAINELKDVQSKMVKLANAEPQEKFTWRPGEGVRSVSEVFMHVAGGNYGIARALGATPPEGINPQTFEKSTAEKAKVVEWLEKSYEHARQAIAKVPDADLEKALARPGFLKINRDAILLLVTHSHEHLGQSIAYARVNGVVPPWTEEQQQRQQQQKQAPPKK